MALTTSLYVHAPTDPLLLFGHALTAVGAQPGASHTAQEADRHGYAYIYTQDMGENLLASLVLARRLNAPLYSRHSAPCGPHWYRLDIHTHYTDPRDDTPHLLHAQVLAGITPHLKRHNTAWSWTGPDGIHHPAETAESDLHEVLRRLAHLRATWGLRMLDNIIPTGPVLTGRVISHQGTSLGTRPRWNGHPHVQSAVLVIGRSPELTPAPATDTYAGTGFITSPQENTDPGWVRVEYLLNGRPANPGNLPAPNPLALARLTFASAGWGTRMGTDHFLAAAPGTRAHTASKTTTA